MIDGISKTQHMIDRYNEFIQHKMSHDEALYLIRLMFELNRHGFERYISDYFHKVQGYKTKVIGGIDDKGIDIEGLKSDGHKYLHLAVQCKKWASRHIKKKDILNFDYDAKNREKTHDNPQLYFITTTRVNSDAKRVAQEKGIMVADCRALLKMEPYYGLDNFRKDTSKWKNNGERLFTNENVIGTIENHLNGKRRVFFPIAK